MRDDYKAQDSLGMNVSQPFHPKAFRQQQNYPAQKGPDMKGTGNDMGRIPNADNGSRESYCTNARGDSENRLKGQIATDGLYLDQK